MTSSDSVCNIFWIFDHKLDTSDLRSVPSITEVCFPYYSCYKALAFEELSDEEQQNDFFDVTTGVVESVVKVLSYFNLTGANKSFVVCVARKLNLSYFCLWMQWALGQIRDRSHPSQVLQLMTLIYLDKTSRGKKKFPLGNLRRNSKIKSLQSWRLPLFLSTWKNNVGLSIVDSLESMLWDAWGWLDLRWPTWR